MSRASRRRNLLPGVNPFAALAIGQAQRKQGLQVFAC
jgi:hypothetical protein